VPLVVQCLKQTCISLIHAHPYLQLQLISTLMDSSSLAALTRR
jgi:hypothetical protein